MTHPPPKSGGPRAAFVAPASPSPSHGDGGVPGPKTSCCPIRKTCAPVGASCFAGVWAGHGRGFGFLGGGGLCWEGLRGMAGVRGFIPRLDIRMSGEETMHGLLARHELEFPRRGGLWRPILLPHILLPRILIPLILVADERKETASSGGDRGCHVNGEKKIHGGLK